MKNIFDSVNLSSYLLFPWLAGACGRAGESRNALELFQTMKDEGLSPDRVAFNALFSALRKANDGERVSFSVVREDLKHYHFVRLNFTFVLCCFNSELRTLGGDLWCPIDDDQSHCDSTPCSIA